MSFYYFCNSLQSQVYAHLWKIRSVISGILQGSKLEHYDIIFLHTSTVYPDRMLTAERCTYAVWLTLYVPFWFVLYFLSGTLAVGKSAERILICMHFDTRVILAYICCPFLRIWWNIVVQIASIIKKYMNFLAASIFLFICINQSIVSIIN